MKITLYLKIIFAYIIFGLVSFISIASLGSYLAQNYLVEEKSEAAVYTWPVKGAVLRDFSVEVLSPDPTMGDWRTHGGLDISAPLEGKVLAMCDGTVAEVRQDGLMGMTVVIDHGEGLTSTYCNLAAEVEVGEGDAVKTGTVIGTVGDTAIAEVGLVSHLHLEVCLNGDAVDPLDYLPELL